VLLGLWGQLQSLVGEAREAGRPGLVTLGMNVGSDVLQYVESVKITSALRCKQASSRRLTRILHYFMFASRVYLRALLRHTRLADEARLKSVDYKSYDGRTLETFAADAEAELERVERLRPLLASCVNSYLRFGFRSFALLHKFWGNADPSAALWTMLLTLFGRPSKASVLRKRQAAVDSARDKAERGRATALPAHKQDAAEYRSLLQLAEEEEASDDDGDVEYV